jgi:hypothetical protein
VSEFNVKLSLGDADHILAALEWALSQPFLIVCECGERHQRKLDLGPGLRESGVERAGRKIEAVADLARQGINAQTTARAAVAAYDAQYGTRPMGEQHDLPRGAVERIEAVVSALRNEVA